MGTSTAAGAEDGAAKNKAKTVTKAKPTKAKTVRKKSPTKTTTKSPSSSNQAIYSAARTAQMELAGQRSAAAARLSDPLWYRIEDVLPVTLDETAMAVPATKVLPEQVQIVEAALLNNNMSRSDVTPQAFCMLLEQARRHALELIADAQDYAISAGRSELGKADFDLAAQMRPDNPIAITTQLPKLSLLSRQINRVPLPPIPVQCYSGILLPPKRHQLTARTFDVVSGAQVTQRMVQPKPSIIANTHSISPSKSAPMPSYGAARGRQIPINLKEREETTAPASSTSTANAPTSAGASADGPEPMAISPSQGPSTQGAAPSVMGERTDGPESPRAATLGVAPAAGAPSLADQL
jgi:Transcription initiation factor IID, 31kD subunit